MTTHTTTHAPRASEEAFARAVAGWVSTHGEDCRTRPAGLAFNLPEDKEPGAPRHRARHRDPVWLHDGRRGSIANVATGEVRNVRELAAREGLSVPAFLERYGDGRTFSPSPAPVPVAVSPDTTHPESAWRAAWDALRGTEERVRRFVEDVRGAWCPADVGTLARVVDKENGTELLALAGERQASFLRHHLPAVVVPLADAFTGALGGLAYRTHDGKKGAVTGSTVRAPFVLGGGRIQPHAVVLLTEGVTDTLAVAGLLGAGGTLAVVGVPGAGGLAEAAAHLSAVHPVVILHDDDTTGRDAAERAPEREGASPVRVVSWADVLGALVASGLEPDDEELKDASDVVRKARRAGLTVDAVRAAFAWGAGCALEGGTR